MHTATEEVKSLRFMLRCLGIPVTGPSNLIGDNLSVIMNASQPEANLKKKHIALSCHIMHESVASSVCTPLWLDSKLNPLDILTKQIGSTEFIGYVNDNFWKPPPRSKGAVSWFERRWVITWDSKVFPLCPDPVGWPQMGCVGLECPSGIAGTQFP